MTSMPASRSARATTFAPRSCPSSPGFAISTRILSSLIARGVYGRGRRDARSGTRDRGFAVADLDNSHPLSRKLRLPALYELYRDAVGGVAVDAGDARVRPGAFFDIGDEHAFRAQVDDGGIEVVDGDRD